jgi:hypothetical protein
MVFQSPGLEHNLIINTVVKAKQKTRRIFQIWRAPGKPSSSKTGAAIQTFRLAAGAGCG